MNEQEKKELELLREIKKKKGHYFAEHEDKEIERLEEDGLIEESGYYDQAVLAPHEALNMTCKAEIGYQLTDDGERRLEYLEQM